MSSIVQARVLHRLAHGDAVGVLLVQPGRIEVADQRARAEEGGLVALAFFFGEADHLEAERQAPARARAARARRPSARRCPGGRRTCRRCARCRSGAGEQASSRRGRCRGSGRPRCRRRRCSPRRSRSRASSAAMLRAAGAVRIGEVGDGELALLVVAGVAVLAPAPPAQSHTRLPSVGLRRRTCRSGASRRCGGCCAGIRRARSPGGCPAGARRCR